MTYCSGAPNEQAGVTEKKGQCVKVMGVVCENEGKAPDQVRCDGREGLCGKVKCGVVERGEKNPSSKMKKG